MQRRWRYANVVTGKQARRQEKEMEWQLIVALVIMIPIILVPVAFVWYLNLGGMRLLLRAVRRTKIAGKERRAAPDEAR
jgi:heme/copper-type cytochrome/quinol oxidase subunit 2